MNVEPEQWSIGRKALIGSLVTYHIWGTLIVVALLKGRDTSVLGDVFSAIAFGIFSTLGILEGGKKWKDFAELRYGPASSSEKTVVTTKQVEKINTPTPEPQSE